MARKTTEQNKTVAILSYILIGLIWYLVDESVRDDFNKFHVKQGLVLLIAYVGAMIISGIFFFISFILIPIVGLASLILMIIGIINAANGKEKELPLIGQFAKHFNF